MVLPTNKAINHCFIVFKLTIFPTLKAMAVATLSHLHASSPVSKARIRGRTGARLPAIFACKGKEGSKDHELQEIAQKKNSFLTSRREALGAAVVAAIAQTSTSLVHAEEENNGWWLTGRYLPVPTISNVELANKETGTRTFVRNGIYMAKVGADGSAYRLRQCALDLLALGDLRGKEAWSHMRRYLCLKSTFMYYDFDKVITAAPVDQKEPLIDLAKKLFDNVEKWEEAIRKHDDPMIESCYGSITPVLEEVRIRMA